MNREQAETLAELIKQDQETHFIFIDIKEIFDDGSGMFYVEAWHKVREIAVAIVSVTHWQELRRF